MTDDREDFQHKQEEYISRLGAETGLKADALSILARADALGHPYVWNWLGVPVIQSPEDVFVIQELLWDTQPDFVVETGVARGGSVIFYASIMELIGHGHVIGVDIDLRAHNRESIESHRLSNRITLIEGSSTSSSVMNQLEELTNGSDRVSVVLDSDHSHDHVAKELDLYSRLVGPRQFLLVADTILEHVPAQVHRPRHWGPGNNPGTALEAFLDGNAEFEVDPAHQRKAPVDVFARRVPSPKEWGLSG